ncbi:hypothetical protein [Actinomadura rubrisoli]|uniref:Uncharacterized protein n=1 Tax=Actinomadura rubrisoli TaxID=2530368 RepID=A0A4R4ZR44_9ACTN|nr:hypothetical protein [Actinomadura rubrisoli]TDD61423.1 hypothetical protein E1298_45390 [Actinomadura rubrisoli]
MLAGLIALIVLITAAITVAVTFIAVNQDGDTPQQPGPQRPPAVAVPPATSPSTAPTTATPSHKPTAAATSSEPPTPPTSPRPAPGRPRASSTPQPDRPAIAAPPGPCNRYRVTARDMALRTQDNEGTGEAIYHGEIATVTRRGTPTGRTDLWHVTTPRAQGWIHPDHRYWSPIC